MPRSGWGWFLAAALSAVAAFGGCASAAPGRGLPQVQPFLIYYGWIPHQPAAFRRFAASVEGYPVVVLGSGDEWPTSGDEGPTIALIQQFPRTTFYGYVDIGMADGQPHHPPRVLQADFYQWHRIGARGVLLDCAGPDYGVSPARLRWAVQAAHQAGLRVLVNAFEPRVVLSAGLQSGDAWLAENWVVADGVPDATTQGFDWSALSALKARGIAIWMTATDRQPPSRAWVTQWVLATVHAVGGQAIAVAGPDYSSQSNAVVPAVWILSALTEKPAV